MPASYKHSSALALAHTCTLYGEAIYGADDMVWYYRCTGSLYQGGGLYTPFELLFYTGDCTHGDSKLLVSFNDKVPRPMTEEEMKDVSIRNAIGRSPYTHAKNVMKRKCK